MTYYFRLISAVIITFLRTHVELINNVIIWCQLFNHDSFDARSIGSEKYKDLAVACKVNILNQAWTCETSD